MKRRRIFSSILLFVLVQIAWFALLGLWIYWYVANYITFTQISERIFPQIIFSTKNVAALTGGIVLLVSVSVGISLIFEKLWRQQKTTRMYDTFIANVTHELKSPLASILLHLETLKLREMSRDRLGEFFQLMQGDAERLGNLIDSILEISELEERRSAIELVEFQADELFRDLIDESVEQYQVYLGQVEVFGQAPIIIRADRRAMKIVINNLIDNAIKYSGGLVHLSVSLGFNRRFINVEVTDSGIGISTGDQRVIFKKFRRLLNPDSPSVKGTGLGLYWVREIIRHHHGKVTVTSGGIGKGSTFKIELPIERRHRSTPAVGRSQRSIMTAVKSNG